MYGWKYGKGYGGKKIVWASTVDISKLNTEKKIVLAYCELSRARHFQRGGKVGHRLGVIANEKGRPLADKTREIFEKAGWHAHIFQNGSCDCSCKRPTYLHSGFGEISVSEVPFSKEVNIDLTEGEMFDGENVRPIGDTLEQLKKRIGDKPLNLVEMADNGEVKDYAEQTVHLIMEAEGLSEVHEIDDDNRTFRSGSQEYTWRGSEDEAENEARESLMQDDEIWKQSVAAGRTQQSLKDWTQEVLDVDGWAHVLCTYDGDYDTLPDGTVYWRTN